MVFLTLLKIMHEPSKLNIFNGFHEYDMMKKGFYLPFAMAHHIDYLVSMMETKNNIKKLPPAMKFDWIFINKMGF